MPYTEFYCQSGGSNMNSGSTSSNSATVTYTSGTWVVGTGVFTVASGNPSSDGVAVGDFAHIYADGGTTPEGIGRVTARDSTTITVSTSIMGGTYPAGASGISCKVGGAWANPSGAVIHPFGFTGVGGMVDTSSNPVRINIKNNSTLNMTASLNHGAVTNTTFQGYTTTVGDGGRFTVDGGTTAMVLLQSTGTGFVLRDAILQNNGTTGSNSGVSIAGAGGYIERVCVNSVRGNGIATTTAMMVVECETYACNQSNTAVNGGYFNSGDCTYIRCIAHDNAGSNSSGFITQTTGGLVHVYINCIADTNGAHGFLMRGRNYPLVVKNCDSYNNTGDGINCTYQTTATGFWLVEDCNLFKNGGWGINNTVTAVLHQVLIRNCAFGAGTQANTSGDVATNRYNIVEGSVTYPSNEQPWFDPTTGDFRIVHALAKGKGSGLFTQLQGSYTGAVGYPDRGAAPGRHAAAGSFLHSGAGSSFNY